MTNLLPIFDKLSFIGAVISWDREQDETFFLMRLWL